MRAVRYDRYGPPDVLHVADIAEPTPGRVGLAEDLDVYDALLRCVQREECVEYGVVEYRYFVDSPDSYRALVARYGHTSLKPTRYSASVFLAHALGQLSAGIHCGSYR